MSIIIDLEFGTNKFNRFRYFENYVAELIESHGCTWLDTELEVIRDDPNYISSFTALPKYYEHMYNKKLMLEKYAETKRMVERDLEEKVCMYSIARARKKKMGQIMGLDMLPDNYLKMSDKEQEMARFEADMRITMNYASHLTGEDQEEETKYDEKIIHETDQTPEINRYKIENYIRLHKYDK